mmetsp:Transcript_15566/g.39448  ORF Transcript_15566/g.39448 Transcript_15566/m.39448 type:complete len:284 (+) Transcript_15566:571-1422(+)
MLDHGAGDKIAQNQAEENNQHYVSGHDADTHALVAAVPRHALKPPALRRPAVLGHGLENREHSGTNILKKHLRGVVGHESIGSPDKNNNRDTQPVNQNPCQHKRPAQGASASRHASDDQPHLLEDGDQPHGAYDPRQPEQAQYLQVPNLLNAVPGGFQHPQHERPGNDHKNRIQQAPRASEEKHTLARDPQNQLDQENGREKVLRDLHEDGQGAFGVGHRCLNAHGHRIHTDHHAHEQLERESVHQPVDPGKPEHVLPAQRFLPGCSRDCAELGVELLGCGNT